MRTNLYEKYMGTAIYIQSKIDGNQYCKTNGQFTKHLVRNNLTYREYYEKYVTGTKMMCVCGRPKTFYQSNETYANSCGDYICIGKLISETKQNWTDEERISDSLNKKKWAEARTIEDKEKSREIRKRTNREKYGVDYTTQSARMMGKSKLTKKERYGYEYYSNPKQTSDTWQTKTSSELNVIADKKRKTCIEKYGVESPFFLPDVRKKSATANSIGREFTMPSGRIIRVRGHEDIAISQLLKVFTEEDLIVDDMLYAYAIPIFQYVNVNQHSMKYYPDIYIPKENKIIEVKGMWWWNGNGIAKYESRLKNNLKKRDAVLEAGYQYEVWLFEDKNNYRILKDETDFITK